MSLKRGQFARNFRLANTDHLTWRALLKTTVFVFGSNREGRHGKGAALEAHRNWGAVYGQAEGRQGNAYAIVTKELRSNKPPVRLTEVAAGIVKFIAYAAYHPELEFQVTSIGCGLAFNVHLLRRTRWRCTGNNQLLHPLKCLGERIASAARDR